MQALRNLFTRRVMLLGIVVSWIGAMAWGFTALTSYGNVPGAIGAVPTRWPVDSALAAPAGKAVLVLAVHPMCPCSKATVAELRELMQQCGDAVVVDALVSLPPSAEPSWRSGPVAQGLQSIPGVAITFDDGRELKRFGALTSGQVMIYSPAGQRVYVGGITGSRGQQGDNAGQSAALAAIRQRASMQRTYPVFGCGL